MNYLSVASGIEAAYEAWAPLGWEPVGFSEISPFPCEVLRQKHPAVPNFGSMLGWREWPELLFDILVGGTPCQSFSVAGLRKGLADDRGNLTLVFCEIADRYDPLAVVWENVPGVLSDKTNAFGCLLAGLVGADAPLVSEQGWTDAGVVAGPKRIAAWRILDAQGFVPQRRRRVFVIASRDVDRLDPVRVLFEAEAEAFCHLGDRAYTGPLFPQPEGLQGDPAAGEETGERVAPTLEARANAGGAGWRTDFMAGGGKSAACHEGPFWNGEDVASTLDDSNASKRQTMPERDRFMAVVEPVEAFGGNNSRDRLEVATAVRAKGGSGHGDFESETFLVQEPLAFQSKASAHQSMNPGPISPTLEVGKSDGDAVAFGCKGDAADAGAVKPPLRAMGHDGSHANAGGQVAVAFTQNSRSEVRLIDDGSICGDGAADAGAQQQNYLAEPVAFMETHSNQGMGVDQSPALTRERTMAVAARMQVRRLTPKECERLQGMKDDTTAVIIRGKPAADGPRYKALGNSFAVPPVRWIGERIRWALNYRATA